MKEGITTARQGFHDILRQTMDLYAHNVYAVTRKFPRYELYAVTSQLRRSALSIILNYIEGSSYGRGKTYKNFLKIAYGSMKESMYLTQFCLVEKYMSESDYQKLIDQADSIGAMLWKTIKNM